MPLSTSHIDPNQYSADDLLTEQQIGEWLGCSPKSVRSWLYKHKIAAADVPGRAKRYRAGNVKDAMKQSRANSEATNASA